MFGKAICGYKIVMHAIFFNEGLAHIQEQKLFAAGFQKVNAGHFRLIFLPLRGFTFSTRLFI